jgi:hypothetical protein
MEMDLVSKQAWFAAQPEPFKIALLIEVLYQLTIVVRGISTQEDTSRKWEAAWEASECHHRVLEYVRALMSRSRDNYPDDVIIEIVHHKLGRAALQPYARSVWDNAVDAATRFGAHLR